MPNNMTNYFTLCGTISDITYKKYIDTTNFAFIIHAHFPTTEWKEEELKYNPMKVYGRYHFHDYESPTPKENTMYKFIGYLCPSGAKGICLYATKMYEVDTYGDIVEYAGYMEETSN